MDTIDIGEMKISKWGRNDGYAVKCIRGLRDIKQSELARLIGVSESTMHNIEDRKVIAEKTLIKIANALKVKPEDITGFHKDCEISIFNDNAKQNNFNDMSSNNEHYGVPVNDYKDMVQKAMEYKDAIANRDMEILKLQYKIEMLTREIALNEAEL